ncbi:MAG TPA: hypothetical protein VG899_06870 [Mycobacteriales bacterium]|nr:hypothetical protein [Mycobacteriales bacterium]HWA66073.1 hypothetical protein [Mycobacteriales bacterium]
MSVLLPAGSEHLRQRDVIRELTRFPSVLWLPAAVAGLVLIGLHSLVAMALCAVLFSTAATVYSVHRACARAARRDAVSLVPRQRLAHDRAGTTLPDRIDVG